MGLNATLYTAGRSLELYSAGIQVAGQNVANANNPNYVREHLYVSTASPYEQGGLLFGTGALADGIRQQIDLYLEKQIHQANSDARASQVRVQAYSQLELTIAELGDQDLSTQMNHFLAAINEVINQPEIMANKQILLQEGADLASSLNSMRSQLDGSRNAVNSSVSGLVTEANDLILQINQLNQQIVRMESAGLLKSDAGGLRSERLAAMNRLSEIMPIRTSFHANGSVEVFSGNDYLVLSGGITSQLETYQTADRGLAVDHVRFANTKQEYHASNGELAGAIEARDSILGGFIDQLDQYTHTLIETINRLHSAGEGDAGFSHVTGTYAASQPGAVLSQAGLPFAVQHGSFDVKIFDLATQTSQTTTINIDLDGLGGDDTSLADLQLMLDGIEHLQASLDSAGRMTLQAESGYEIRFGNDSSGVLAAMGINTFFQGTDANTIAVNQKLQGDPALLATGSGGGPGDNTNAIKLAGFMEQTSSQLGGLTLDGFYLQMVNGAAQAAKAEKSISAGYQSFQASLMGQRQQISGVSLDEEAIRIMEMQHGYMAAARIITTVEELFRTLVNL